MAISKAGKNVRRLKVLELFSGTGSISKAFEARGHETFRVDWDEDFDADLHCDIESLTAGRIIELFGHPDVIHASPDCATFSVAAISRHRRKGAGGWLEPISEYAEKSDRVDVNLMRIIRDLRPALYFIENPRAGMRKAPWIQWAPRYTVTYCKYMTDRPLEQRRMKPTDFWTNHPNPSFIEPCKNGDPCHARAPRGSLTGTQGRSLLEKYAIPPLLCQHIVDISEDYIHRLDMANEYLASQGLDPITPRWEEEAEPSEPQQRLFS